MCLSSCIGVPPTVALAHCEAGLGSSYVLLSFSFFFFEHLCHVRVAPPLQGSDGSHEAAPPARRPLQRCRAALFVAQRGIRRDMGGPHHTSA